MHHVAMREWWGWVGEGRTVGWDHSWFNGYPVYQFYFPAPAVLWVALDVFFPSHTAYLLMTVLCVPATVWALWWAAVTWGMGRRRAFLLSASAMVAFCAMGWLYHRQFTGGLFSVMYGQFAHQWSVVFGLCYLAALNNAVRTRKWEWATLAGMVLAASALSHPYPAAMFALCSATLLSKRHFSTFAWVGFVAAGLTMWWWLPVVGQLHMAHFDIARRGIGWDKVFSYAQLVCLPPALVAAYRLRRSVQHPRMLLPPLVLALFPIAAQLVLPHGLLMFDYGRPFFWWFMMVGGLAVFLVVDIATEKTLKTGRQWLSHMAYAALLGVAVFFVSSLAGLNIQIQAKNVDSAHPSVCPNEQALDAFPNPGPATVFAAGLWLETGHCGHAHIGYGSIFGRSDLPTEHRSVAGLLRESSPTSVFHYILLRNDNYAGLKYLTSEHPTEGDREAAVTQMMTLGVDYYWSDRASIGAPGPVAGKHLSPVDGEMGTDLLAVVNKPGVWPAVWYSHPDYGKFIQLSANRFEQWRTPEQVTIPVLGAQPANNDNPLRVAAPLDLSDDHYVRFEAAHSGAYYVTVSYHPNWEMLTHGSGPYPAGPNQMVVLVDRAGTVELEWSKPVWETAGQWVTALLALSLVAITTRRLFGKNEERATLPT